jgi:hypothetical protein
MAALPYVTAPGNIERALLGIKAAATPSTVSLDFIKTILKIPGGSGNQISSLLRKVGFVNVDGTPSDIYKKFRNSSTSGAAAAEALQYAYAPLKQRNEYWYKLPDDKLRGLIIEETGQEEESNIVNLILATIKGFKKFAEFDKPASEPRKNEVVEAKSTIHANMSPITQVQSLGLNLGYTINLNLPPTSDIAVFNAIFKSLKENLLKGPDGSQ